MKEAARTAQAIREELKSIGIKAKSIRSETYSGGSSVYVSLKDQSPEVVAQVRSITAKYKYGHFDSMTDSFEYSNVRKDIPQARHIFVENEISGELKEKIFQALKSEYFELNQFETVPEDA